MSLCIPLLCANITLSLLDGASRLRFALKINQQLRTHALKACLWLGLTIWNWQAWKDMRRFAVVSTTATACHRRRQIGNDIAGAVDQTWQLMTHALIIVRTELASRRAEHCLLPLDVLTQIHLPPIAHVCHQRTFAMIDVIHRPPLLRFPSDKFGRSRDYVATGPVVQPQHAAQ